MPKRRVKRHAVTQPQDPSYRLIPLTRNQNAIVDAADFERLNQWNWCALWCPSTNSFRAKRMSPSGSTIYMSREIMCCKPDEEADHKNHDTLDNRRQNLRMASHRQNGCNLRVPSTNTSGFIGVSWNRQRGKWTAQIKIKRRNHFLGLFVRKEEAAKAHDRAAKQYHGEFASLNFR
jgi:hypothetical protein